MIDNFSIIGTLAAAQSHSIGRFVRFEQNYGSQKIILESKSKFEQQRQKQKSGKL
ncbi:hypothetical protein HanXRQr2_Chr01g0024711 [Helianthus annuus]|uniref:Uncharacterized protein n=1 Tax=Helianthus annuus TaxID=4232 RepID=A0A9K3P345_HELAN|nr:hypothetical protein HanXRQr2_Chr01g0024711 [Helianthus annuus]